MSAALLQQQLEVDLILLVEDLFAHPAPGAKHGAGQASPTQEPIASPSNAPNVAPVRKTRVRSRASAGSSLSPVLLWWHGARMGAGYWMTRTVWPADQS